MLSEEAMNRYEMCTESLQAYLNEQKNYSSEEIYAICVSILTKLNDKRNKAAIDRITKADEQALIDIQGLLIKLEEKFGIQLMPPEESQKLRIKHGLPELSPEQIESRARFGK